MKLAMVVAVMAFAGFTAGLLGIGGALIFNPVLLQLGVQPQVGLARELLRRAPAASAHILEQRTRLGRWSVVCNARHVAPMSKMTHATLVCRSLPLPAC